MQNTQLKKMWTEMVLALKQSERFYALDDNHAVHVELNVGRFDEHRLTGHVAIMAKVEEKRGDEVEIDWDHIDMESLPARLLGRVVEIKTTVERWNAGELEDLPPSTITNFLAEQEERRNSRRGRRRRY